MGRARRVDPGPLRRQRHVGQHLRSSSPSPAIDGALVGGASLKPDEMAGIVARAGITAAARGLASAGDWGGACAPRARSSSSSSTGSASAAIPPADAVAAADMPSLARPARGPGRTRSSERPRTRWGLPAGQMGNSEVGHLVTSAPVAPCSRTSPGSTPRSRTDRSSTAPALPRACASSPGDRPPPHRRPRRPRWRPRPRPAPAGAGRAGRAAPASPRSGSMRCSTGATRHPYSALGFVRDLEASARDDPSGCPRRVSRRPVLGDGPRPALGAHRAGVRRDRARGGGARALGDGGDRGRRTREARPTSSSLPTVDRRRRRVRCATATRSSTSTSGPTARASWCTRSRTRGSVRSSSASPDGRPAPTGLLVVTMTAYEAGLAVEVAFGPEEAPLARPGVLRGRHDASSTSRRPRSTPT